MKRLIILWTLLLLPIIAGAQFSVNSVGFKAYRVDVYQGEDTEEGFYATKRESYNVNVLFYIEDSKVSTMNMRGQFKSFRFENALKYYSNLAENVPGYETNCKDLGGFRCTFTIFCLKKANSYRIRIDYSNLRMYFYCNLTNERPWDGEQDLVKEAQSWRDDPDYTDEEIINFFQTTGKDFLKFVGLPFIK